MPGGDGTGPQGMGAMTGRGAGFCAGYNMPGYMNRGVGFGAGFGPGRGRGGRGYRHMYRATGLYGWQRAGHVAPAAFQQPPSPEEERLSLAEQADALEAGLREVRERLARLEGASAQR